jgi:uncharacterized protein YlxP (DUF503 family)
MFIGVARFEIFIPESVSLKDKRQVVRSVTGTVRRKLNVSVAEVAHQELWQRAAVGVTCVAESIGHCRKVMQEVEKTIGRAAFDGAEIVDRTIEIVALEDLT